MTKAGAGGDGVVGLGEAWSFEEVADGGEDDKVRAAMEYDSDIEDGVAVVRLVDVFGEEFGEVEDDGPVFDARRIEADQRHRGARSIVWTREFLTLF